MLTPSTEADHQICRQILAQGSKSFALAARLLPAELTRASAALYAFCRVADDAIDEAADPAAGLAALKVRVDRIFAGSPADDPVDRAFAEVVAAHRLPRAVVDALLEGFAWDVAARRYQTLEELLAYCARVASTVGVLMTMLMGERRPSMLARAADLGLAMQLTNIARDVGEDARAGRLYLPLELLAQAGLDPQRFMDNPQPSPATAQIVGQLLERADCYYRRADEGIIGLPRSVRWGIGTARLVYAAIGARIRAAQGDSVSQRRFVPLWRKLLLGLGALRYLLAEGSGGRAPADPSTAFLVRAERGPA